MGPKRDIEKSYGVTELPSQRRLPFRSLSVGIMGLTHVSYFPYIFANMDMRVFGTAVGATAAIIGQYIDPNGVGRPVVVATTPEIKPIIKKLLGDRQNRGEINEQTTSHSKKTDT